MVPEEPNAYLQQLHYALGRVPVGRLAPNRNKLVQFAQEISLREPKIPYSRLIKVYVKIHVEGNLGNFFYFGGFG